MSVKALAFVWDETDHKGTPKLVLLAIADWANDEGLATPLMKKLESRVGVGKTALRNHLARLEKDGVLGVVKGAGFQTKRGNGNLFALNEYRHSVGLEPMITSHYTRDTTSNPTLFFGGHTDEPVQIDDSVDGHTDDSVDGHTDDTNTVIDTGNDTLTTLPDDKEGNGTNEDETLETTTDEVKHPTLLDYVAKTYGLDAKSSIVINIFNLLMGRAKKGEWGANRIPSAEAVTEREYMAFHEWYRRNNRDDKGRPFELPREPMKINTWVYQFRADPNYEKWLGLYDEHGYRVGKMSQKRETAISPEDEMRAIMANSLVPMGSNNE
jgi:hypothetical protein